MIQNKTKQKIITKKIRFARTALARARGLMFAFPASVDYGLVFDFGTETTWRASVHNWFVFFPIDLVYLNANKRVVDIKRNFKPFALPYAPAKPARFLVELPAGNANEIKLNDELEWPTHSKPV